MTAEQERSDRIWEWAQRLHGVLAPQDEDDDGHVVAVAEFLAGQPDLLDHPQPVLTDHALLVISRAIAWERDVR